MKKLFFLILFIFMVIAGWIYQSEISTYLKSILDKSEVRLTQNEAPLKYDNSDIGFSFEYPSDIQFLKAGTYPNDPSQTYLHVELKNIGEKTDPMDFNMDDAMKNIEALNRGDFGLEYGFPYGPSKKVKTVGFLFAQDYLVLARFEMCSVLLERKLLFYFNNKQITITIIAPVKELKNSMSEYFTVNKENCGDEIIWNFDKQEEFYNRLLAGTASSEIQKWFDTFDEISESIIFAHR